MIRFLEYIITPEIYRIRFAKIRFDCINVNMCLEDIMILPDVYHTRNFVKISLSRGGPDKKKAV